MRIRPYNDRDAVCFICCAESIPEVKCLDMDTLEYLPVPLALVWHNLWQYVLCDELCSGQKMFSGRPMRFCKALISLIRALIYSRQT